MNGPERRRQRQAEAEAQSLVRPKTPAEQLATEIDGIHDKWFHRNPHALADILDAVARYEAAEARRVLGTNPEQAR